MTKRSTFPTCPLLLFLFILALSPLTDDARWSDLGRGSSDGPKSLRGPSELLFCVASAAEATLGSSEAIFLDRWDILGLLFTRGSVYASGLEGFWWCTGEELGVSRRGLTRLCGTERRFCCGSNSLLQRRRRINIIRNKLCGRDGHTFSSHAHPVFSTRAANPVLHGPAGFSVLPGRQSLSQNKGRSQVKPRCSQNLPPSSTNQIQAPKMSFVETSPSSRPGLGVLPDEDPFEELQFSAGVAGPVLLHLFKQTLLQHKGVVAPA